MGGLQGGGHGVGSAPDLQELTVGQGSEHNAATTPQEEKDGTWTLRILGAARTSISGQLPGEHTDNWETFFLKPTLIRKGSKGSFGGERNVLYLDWSGGSLGTYICQTHESHT